MATSLVNYSRAGDIFHYRWAARRCLRLIDPQYGLQSIVVEGSKEPLAPGEYVIDLTEYYGGKNHENAVAYYQLKHSSVRTQIAFTLADLKKTLRGFADRFRAARDGKSQAQKPRRTTFAIVTNRPIDNEVKAAFAAMHGGGTSPNRTALERATGLSGIELREFCGQLSFVDREGDYRVQKRRLQGEIAEYLAGFVEGDDAELIVSLVTDRVMPESEDGKSDGEITPEAVLQKLGVTSSRDLFPAIAAFDAISNPIRREQHDAILRHILGHRTPSVIHAAGGVGKSVVARLVADSLPRGSQAILYDCFGAGRYLSPSEPRHRARDALVQMANELAARGLCRKLLPRRGLAPDDFFRGFQERIVEAVDRLREINRDAMLVLLVDAADNAEMAAQDRGEPCFAQALLKLPLPDGCRLALFARTERVHLLKPGADVRLFPLSPFSEAESLSHLRCHFADATEHDGREFHRLSGGNPRVQANGLAVVPKTLEAVLAGLGPNVTSLDAQIAAQLQAAVDALRARTPNSHLSQIDAICLGLANLPPLIPIPVLAKAAGVADDTVKSFVADLGRPLWHSDDAVQFRDEPTETWFRQRFAADATQVKAFVAILEPLSGDFAYAAKALPQLLLRAGEHDRLLSLALSDQHLPSNNPIEERNVRVYRLQFAFKAALKLHRLADAAKLAFRAGEEVAGDMRQTELLTNNIDLVASLEEPNRVQEIAYRHLLGAAWPGCENIYSAALLAPFADFKGDARAFLRSASRWLTLHFKERKKRDPHDRSEALTDAHVVELAWAQFHLSGPEELATQLARWTPPDLVLRVMQIVVRRLADAGRFEEINAIAFAGRRLPYLVLAIANELVGLARLPEERCLRDTLSFLSQPKKRPARPDRIAYDDRLRPAVVSFLEACAARRMPSRTILRILNFYTERTPDAVLSSDYQEGGRSLFLRGIVLRAILANEAEPTIESLYPKPKKKPQPHEDDSDERNKRQMLGSLLPWHYARTQCMVRPRAAKTIDLKALDDRAGVGLGSRYRNFDRLPFEVAVIRFALMAWKKDTTAEKMSEFNLQVVQQAHQKFWLPDRLDAVRLAVRTPHLQPLVEPLEQSCRKDLERVGTERPEEIAAYYVRLGRAVLPASRDDAVAYFGAAVDAVSKFGDEMVARWEGLVAVADRSAEPGPISPELAYRFVRCGELIGATVDREKHWHRNGMFHTALRLDVPTAFATLSRWRDRGVGWFDEQLEALAIAAVKQRRLDAAPLWALSGFAGCNASSGFTEACLRQESDPTRRKLIFDRAVEDVALADSSAETLRTISSEFGLSNAQLPLLVKKNVSDSEYSPIEESAESFTAKLTASETKRWGHYFRRFNFQRAGAIGRALRAFADSETPRDSGTFWNQLTLNVPRGQERPVIQDLLATEDLMFYEAGYAVHYVRQNWLQRAAVSREWPHFLKAVGRRFAAILSDRSSLWRWTEEGHVTAEDVLVIRRGILEGLSDSLDLVDAGTFFGFVSNTAPDLTPAEARTLLDYSLGRFERHMDPAFGDGPFATWLIPPTSPIESLAGLIWGALASPFSDTRWEAAHCVRRLAELECDGVIDALVDWMKKGTAGAFVSKDLPFYALHAKLYLMLAFARIAVDRPGQLVRHARAIADAALTGLPHILIQTMAARTALAIEAFQPGSYSSATVASLRHVGRSPLPDLETKDDRPKINTPWHERKEIDASLKYHFGMDFDDYWLRPLGDAFGVAQKQVEDLVRQIVVRDLGVPSSDDFTPDPRQKQWESRDRDAYYYKSSYPRTDNFRFYVSYHGMHSAAARMLANMAPVVHPHRTWREHPWQDWIESHSLTRNDGRWLSDRRDPVPMQRRPWVRSRDQHWLWTVAANDFFFILHPECPLADGLCVDGNWSDCVDDRVETIRVESALVNPSTGEALANSLRCAGSPMDYRLPNYAVDSETKDRPPFDLIGWILDRDGGDARIDSFDPYAKGIQYPPVEIGESFATQLGLTADIERRTWTSDADGKRAALGEIWSMKPPPNPRRESHYRWGRRLSVTLPTLRRLCSLTGRDLILSVVIDRSWKSNFDEKGFSYIPGSHKIFVLSTNGRLRDATKSHRLG